MRGRQKTPADPRGASFEVSAERDNADINLSMGGLPMKLKFLQILPIFLILHQIHSRFRMRKLPMLKDLVEKLSVKI